MIRTFWEKLSSLFDDDDASQPMPEEWSEDLEDAEKDRPGHDIQAGQIGMFS